jgi:hypothetical protein
VAAILITTLPSTSISFNHTSTLIIITAFLRKSKAALLELIKMMSDVHIAEEEDFVMWSQQFINITISHR